MYGYFILNVAILAGYLIARLILDVAFKEGIPHSQRLVLARVIFITIILAFLLAPKITIMPSHYTQYDFEPILKSASASFSQAHAVASLAIEHTTHRYLLVDSIFILLLFTGMVVSLLSYLRHLTVLNKLVKKSYLHHSIDNTNILFTDSTAIAFCWSGFKNNYIIIPLHYLENSVDLKLALRHELQHLRQHDTVWWQALIIVKAICFWNPALKMWMNWFDELQEFACDEAILKRKTMSVIDYAQCLVNAVTHATPLPACTLGMSSSILNRRVNMIFNNRKKFNKLSLFIAYGASALLSLSTAFALNGGASLAPLSMQELRSIIKATNIDKSFQLSATPELLNEINNIRGNEKAKAHVAAALQRMKQYEGEIKQQLHANNMPNDLLAVPLMESGYRALSENQNPVKAAGIWQIIPNTAMRLGLSINANQDDRMNIQLATKAALQLLKQDQQQFGDWKLAFVAYEIGEDSTEKLIKATGSHDVWQLARLPSAPKSLKRSLAMFDARLLIMRDPALIA